MDYLVSFKDECFADQINIERQLENGPLTRRDVSVEIYAAKDQESDYLLLKQVNINLAQFVDTGKIEDVITFEDLKIVFVFDMQVASNVTAKP